MQLQADHVPCALPGSSDALVEMVFLDDLLGGKIFPRFLRQLLGMENAQVPRAYGHLRHHFVAGG